MSEENFLYWKELVGLDRTDFPKLAKPTEEGAHRIKISPSRTERIRKKIMENEKVAVLVNPGWGATTLFYWIEKDLRPRELNLLITFNFEKYGFDGIIDEEDFVFSVKWKMAKEIIDSFRQGSFQERYMYEVLSFEETGNTRWGKYLVDKSRDIKDCERKRDRFYKEWPFFEKYSITDIIYYFLRNFQLQTIFMFLFPRKAREDDVLEFVGNIKMLLDEQMDDEQKKMPAAFREVYFITPWMFKILNQDYERPYMEERFERYSSAELFSMLVQTYQERGQVVTINDIFDELFISRVYNTKLTIDEIMDEVREEIVSFLDGDFSNVPYRLSLSMEDEKEFTDDHK